MTILTFITTIANILLWLATRQTVTLLVQQIRHQVASGHSEAKHYIVEAHRDIFFRLLNNPSLLQGFTQANNLDAQDWELQKVSSFLISFLINQVMVNYLNFQNDIISQSHFDGFKRDAQDVFEYATVRSHWEKVRLTHSHSEDFRRFVDTQLL
ncbi:MAG: hypothetical protein AAGD25_22435 [Cyanobacteria bacterium P01_F01_bin.150]